MVQAIAHVFNGASSSTRTIQDLNEEEYDREKAEGSDKPVQDNASISAQKEMVSYVQCLKAYASSRRQSPGNLHGSVYHLRSPAPPPTAKLSQR